MCITAEKINQILQIKNLSKYRLSKMLDYYESSLNKVINKKMPFPEYVIERLLPILEVSREEFDSWIIADKYSKKVIELAIKAKQETKVKKKELILTVKIDEILKKKEMSRTNLAKQINYSQSGLNRMIVGKISMSESIISKISPILELNENTIKSWILADKYPLETLELARYCHSELV